MSPEPSAQRRNWREMDMIAAGWVPPEEAETLRKAVDFWKTAAYDEEAERDWSAYAQDVSTQLMFAEARVRELEASWVPPERVETIGTADLKDRLVSLDDGWVSLPPRLMLPHALQIVRAE